MKKIIIFSLIITLLLLVKSPVLAQEETPLPSDSPLVVNKSDNSDVGFVPNPESLWFGLQNAFMRVSENIQLMMARTEEKKAELELKFAQKEEKLTEKVANSKNPEKFGKLLEKLQERQQQRLQKLDQKLEKLGERKEEFRQRMEQITNKLEERRQKRLENRLERREDINESTESGEREDQGEEGGIFLQERVGNQNFLPGEQVGEKSKGQLNDQGSPDQSRRRNIPRPSAITQPNQPGGIQGAGGGNMPPSTRNVHGAQAEQSVLQQVWNRVVGWFE